MSKTIKPNSDSKCIECGKPMEDEKPFLYTKQRSCPPVFIHPECYDKLPKVGSRKSC